MHRGIESFCNRKQVNTIKTVKLFTKETGLNAETNFTRFATFVDKKIKSGELKGNDAPLNKEMWEESRREKAEYDAIMATYTTEQRQFYGRVKRVGRNTLDQFFGKRQLTKPKQTESKTKLGRMLPIFDYLKENELLEEFMNYKYEKL